MNIVADENIPYAKEAFETLGSLRILPGRAIKRSDLTDVTILLIRSLTKVNEDLLHDTPVRFVGCTTAGTDHVDIGYLHQQGIGFASAAGCNANSVAEYVITTLLILAKQKELSLRGQSLGIIGVGHIGSKVKAKAEVLGMTVVLNDPPLAELTGDVHYRSLEEALGCDAVTLHVPLSLEGRHRTLHLLDEHMLHRVNPSAFFLNASRGEVVETQALLTLLGQTPLAATVLDVWEGEPDISWELFQQVTWGTPHIAGHSLDGKVQGTFMAYKALCEFLNIEPVWDSARVLRAENSPTVEIDVTGKSVQDILYDLTTGVYDPLADHLRMSQLLTLPQNERPKEFDRLRKEYPIRREWPATNVRLLEPSEELRQQLLGLGFRVEGPE